MRSYKFKRWILLFSHTGGEAATIVEHLYHTFPNPIHIITNQTDTEAYTKNFPVCIESHIGDPIENKEYLEAHFMQSKAIWSVLSNIKEKTLITCHGFNRIIPVNILENPNLEIYNMHPGDTMTYPQLVGKDPQEKAIALNLPSTGVMLHKVTEDLDGGPLYGFIRKDIAPETDLGELVSQLKEESLNLWFPFLVSKLGESE